MSRSDEKPPRLPAGAVYKRLTTRVILVDNKNMALAEKIAKKVGGKIYTGHHGENGVHTIELAEGVGVVNVSDIYVIPDPMKVSDEVDWTEDDQMEMIEHIEGWPNRFAIEAMTDEELNERLDANNAPKSAYKLQIRQKRARVMDLENVGNPVE